MRVLVLVGLTTASAVIAAAIVVTATAAAALASRSEHRVAEEAVTLSAL